VKRDSGAVDVVAIGFCLAVVLLAVVAALLGSCLPMHGNPRCFACGNLVDGTALEDPKCCVGPCAPGTHVVDGGPDAAVDHD
jgi:hypothetical protein